VRKLTHLNCCIISSKLQKIRVFWFYTCMPNILLKSQENLTAAQELINKRRFTSSVHCSYYSVLQFMKYILHHKCSFDYSSQNDCVGGDSHDVILTGIIKAGKGDTFIRNLRTNFYHIKRERKRADYEDGSLFSDLESIDVRDKSEALISNLKREFQIREYR